jgi:hypothetical protein
MNPVPNRAPKYSVVRNEELYRAMLELRQGSRTSPQSTDKNKNNRTRKAAKRNAIKESMDS